MKTLPIIFIACLVMGCSQQKTISQQKSKIVHRYKTVYEGKRIIQYKEQSTVTSHVPKSDYRVSTAMPVAEIQIDRSHITRLPLVRFKKRRNAFLKDGIKRTYPDLNSNYEVTNRNSISGESGGGNIGIGILLIIVSFPVFLYGLVIAAWGVPLIGVLLMLLGIAALVFGIVLIARA